MNNVVKRLTKKLDMTVALQKAEASAWANHKEGMILDMKLSRKRERQLESQIARMNQEHQFELEKEKIRLLRVTRKLKLHTTSRLLSNTARH